MSVGIQIISDSSAVPWVAARIQGASFPVKQKSLRIVDALEPFLRIPQPYRVRRSGRLEASQKTSGTEQG